MKKLFCFPFFVAILINWSKGQTSVSSNDSPFVGRPCPDITFSKIDFYKSRKVQLMDLKGKWVVLDFWSRFCSGCIASFPRISNEQRALGDSVQFIMVAPDSTTGERALYMSYHKRLKLAMPAAFDNGLFKSFNIGGLPFTVIINPNGIIMAVTGSAEGEKIRALMHGDHPAFSSAAYAEKTEFLNKTKFDYKRPYLVAGNGGTDSNFVFRSLLAQWHPGDPTFTNSSMLQSKRYVSTRGQFQCFVRSIDILYLAAYSGVTDIGRDDTSLYGKFSPNPIFEIRDSSLLQYDVATGKNLFSYSLIVPREKATEKYMMSVMQNDLKNYFGYQVNLETRKMPYWKLVLKNRSIEKLKSKGGPLVETDNGKPYQELSLRNYPMDSFLRQVSSFSRVDIEGIPLIDETGIDFNIDIDLIWTKGNYDICRKALQKKGLDLVKGEKEMKVIVIREPEPIN